MDFFFEDGLCQSDKLLEHLRRALVNKHDL